MSRGRHLQSAGGPRRTTLPRRPCYLAHSSSCCRPPRGGRRAALLMLRFGALSTGSSMAEALGRRRTYLLRRHLPLHALARPSCYRRAASAAHALAGVVAYGLADTPDARAASDAARATSSLLCALVELLPTAARRASGSAPRASARRALHGLVDDRGARAAPHVLTAAPPFTTRARAAVVLPTGR